MVIFLVDVGGGGRVEHTPNQAVKHQLPLSFCLKMASNYPNHPLPTSMTECRVLHLTNHLKEEVVEQFYRDVLLTIRASLEDSHKFMITALSRDPGTPSLSQLPPEHQLYHLTSTRCALCGHPYYDQNLGISHKPLRPTIHHHHLLADAQQNTISLCNLCNLSLMSQYNSRIPHILLGQNAANYDHIFLLTAAIVAGKTLVPIVSESRGGETIGFVPLLKRKPSLLLKEAQSIIKMEMRWLKNKVLGRPGSLGRVT